MYEKLTNCQEIFIPMMGRVGGGHVNPEVFIMFIALLPVIASGIFLVKRIHVQCFIFTLQSSLLYISRPIGYLFKLAVIFTGIIWLLTLFSSLGYPYVYTKEAPRLKRIILLVRKCAQSQNNCSLQHTTRTRYDINDKSTVEHGLWYQTLDARTELPTGSSEHVAPVCSNTPDEYCDMPFYGPTKDAFLIE